MRPKQGGFISGTGLSYMITDIGSIL